MVFTLATDFVMLVTVALALLHAGNRVDSGSCLFVNIDRCGLLKVLQFA